MVMLRSETFFAIVIMFRNLGQRRHPVPERAQSPGRAQPQGRALPQGVSSPQGGTSPQGGPPPPPPLPSHTEMKEILV